MRNRAPDPLCLALDSAGSACSAAVAVGGNVLAVESMACLHGQAEKLMPMIDTVMRQAGLPPAALDLVVTTVGPGSFTGIRAGIAAARGIALAVNARLVGVTSFDAVAAGSAAPGRQHSGFLLVTLESRREDFFVQIFDRARDQVGEPMAVAPSALLDMVNAAVGKVPLLIAGDAAHRALSVLTGRPHIDILEHPTPPAIGALRAAIHCLQSGGSGEAARPLYLRAPDATPSRRRTEAPGGRE
jgi:tRNA threonylcarbamoyladenosine biosynthesis protein TsaB